MSRRLDTTVARLDGRASRSSVSGNFPQRRDSAPLALLWPTAMNPFFKLPRFLDNISRSSAFLPHTTQSQCWRQTARSIASVTRRCLSCKATEPVEMPDNPERGAESDENFDGGFGDILSQFGGLAAATLEPNRAPGRAVSTGAKSCVLVPNTGYSEVARQKNQDDHDTASTCVLDKTELDHLPHKSYATKPPSTLFLPRHPPRLQLLHYRVKNVFFGTLDFGETTAQAAVREGVKETTLPTNCWQCASTDRAFSTMARWRIQAN